MLGRNANVFIVIVTYNAMKWVKRCLDSVLQSSLKAKVIIVDNVSTDGTVEYVKKNHPDFVLLEQKKNGGFGAGNNLGIKYALFHGADYIYLLNQDAWFESNTLKILCEIMDNNPQYGLLSPLQITATMNNVDRNVLRFMTDDKNKAKQLLSGILTNQNCKIYDVEFFPAAHWLLRAETLKKTGFFSDVFLHYGEDVNLYQRILYNGFKCGMVLSTKGIHDRQYRIMKLEDKIFSYYNLILSKTCNPNMPYVYNLCFLLLYTLGIPFYLIYMYIVGLCGTKIKEYYYYIASPIKILQSLRKFKNTKVCFIKDNQSV